MLRKGFTLIELLIVVAIIAILAAIAIPNFLEAQVRSKVSRAKADMRSIATALESYFTDANHYPNHSENGWPYYLTIQLTTPTRYLSSASLHDPFKDTGHAAKYASDYPRRFRYLNSQAWLEKWPDNLGTPYDVGETNDVSDTIGGWKLVSAGPDKKENTTILNLSLIYDPTNGTYSLGDIIRTQKESNVVKSRD